MKVEDLIRCHPIFPGNAALHAAINGGRRADTAYRTHQYLDAEPIAIVEIGSALYNLYETHSDTDLLILSSKKGPDIQIILGDLDVRVGTLDGFMVRLSNSVPDEVDILHSSTGLTYLDQSYSAMIRSVVYNPYVYIHRQYGTITTNLNTMARGKNQRKLLKQLLRSYCMIRKVEQNPGGFSSTFTDDERARFFQQLEYAVDLPTLHRRSEEMHNLLENAASLVVRDADG